MSQPIATPPLVQSRRTRLYAVPNVVVPTFCTMLRQKCQLSPPLAPPSNDTAETPTLPPRSNVQLSISQLLTVPVLRSIAVVIEPTALKPPPAPQCTLTFDFHVSVPPSAQSLPGGM